MRYEFKNPLLMKDWRPLKAETLADAVREVVAMGPLADDAVVREADTKKKVDLPDPYGRNGGIRCDTQSGPCSCGAWH